MKSKRSKKIHLDEQGNECKYYVLPYDLLQTIKDTIKMESGIRQTMKFLVNSRLTADEAKRLCAKTNRKKSVKY